MNSLYSCDTNGPPAKRYTYSECLLHLGPRPPGDDPAGILFKEFSTGRSPDFDEFRKNIRYFSMWQFSEVHETCETFSPARCPPQTPRLPTLVAIRPFPADSFGFPHTSGCGQKVSGGWTLTTARNEHRRPAKIPGRYASDGGGCGPCTAGAMTRCGTSNG